MLDVFKKNAAVWSKWIHPQCDTPSSLLPDQILVWQCKLIHTAHPCGFGIFFIIATSVNLSYRPDTWEGLFSLDAKNTVPADFMTEAQSESRDTEPYLI